MSTPSRRRCLGRYAGSGGSCILFHGHHGDHVAQCAAHLDTAKIVQCVLADGHVGQHHASFAWGPTVEEWPLGEAEAVLSSGKPA